MKKAKSIERAAPFVAKFDKNVALATFATG